MSYHNLSLELFISTDSRKNISVIGCLPTLYELDAIAYFICFYLLEISSSSHMYGKSVICLPLENFLILSDMCCQIFCLLIQRSSKVLFEGDLTIEANCRLFSSLYRNSNPLFWFVCDLKSLQLLQQVYKSYTVSLFWFRNYLKIDFIMRHTCCSFQCKLPTYSSLK